MFDFLEPICRSACSTPVYNFLGQYLWPNLMNSSVVGPAILVTTAVVATATVGYIALTGKKKDEHHEAEKDEKLSSVMVESNPTPAPAPSRPQVDTKIKRRAREIQSQLHVQFAPLPVPTVKTDGPAPVAVIVETEAEDLESRQDRKEKAVHAFETHADRLGQLLQNGSPTDKKYQESTDDSEMAITEATFVTAYLKKHPNVSRRIRYNQGGARGKQDVLREIFDECDLKDLQGMPTSLEGKARIRSAYNTFK